MDVINPYEFLGVTIDDTPHTVRKAYHSLALLLHPDRGGCADDMIMLQKAYEYVSEQIACVDRSQAAFSSFCAAAHAVVVPSMDELNEAIFGRAWLDCSGGGSNGSSTVWRASYTGGYGDFMARSDVVSTAYVDVEDGEAPPVFSSDAMELALALDTNANAAGGGAPLDAVELDVSLENYTTAAMCDYREAFAHCQQEDKQTAI